jgi:hypothetical protein
MRPTGPLSSTDWIPCNNGPECLSMTWRERVWFYQASVVHCGGARTYYNA